ncbi:MAG: glutamine synthetase beta-grasp domain-containing protein [Candidatus Bathyarchaeota archaeon]|nr:glutamine synthetase beta-grasp domain-containing protein [Candidatus Bathyarchaeota archaeon]MDH5494634.1 glutamine synthetase beta-grasp domain-containing protein [Candidatus Bathyarchaeota archaeon]
MSEVTELIQKEKVKEIVLQFTDISGILHSLWIPSELFSKVAEEGIHVDGSSIGMVDIDRSDLKLIPDVKTFVVLPPNVFSQRVARVVCDIYEPESNRPFELDPRFVLQKVMNNVKKNLGASVNYYASAEMEHFLFKRGEDGNVKLLDEGGYLATPPTDLSADIRLEITENFRNMDILIEKHHHEVPPGKYELNLAYSNALRMADTVYLVKFLVKLVAAKNGLIASFMPKPFSGQFGAGLHTHVSLINDEKGQNLFYDPNGSYGLSKTALNFIVGILSHAKALAAITNPTVNSYKRLVPGWEAPVYISWAKYNRSVLVRVPPGKEKRTRLEYRPTDGSCNFYLAFAAILSAGLDGIKRKIEPPKPVEEDIYEMSEKEKSKRGIEVLPGNLGDALREFSKDKYIQEALGKAFCEKFLELKTQEWRDFNVTVHEWERTKYLDV